MALVRLPPRRRHPAKFAVCIENSGYPASLELHKIYRAVPDQDAAREGDLRIVDESGEDYLYPAEWFVAVEVPRRVRTLHSFVDRPGFNPHNPNMRPTAFGRGRHARMRHPPFSLGSRRSRRASPSMLKPKTASDSATAGQIASHGARYMWSSPASDSIPPQVG